MTTLRDACLGTSAMLFYLGPHSFERADRKMVAA